MFTWLRQNWMWFLPLAILACFVPMTTAIFTTILVTCFIAIRSSTLFRQIMRRVGSHPQVSEHLGSPARPGLFVLGNVCRRPTGTLVNLNIPLGGPLGQGRIFAVAVKKEGAWQFNSLELQCRNQGPRIDLLSD